MNLNVEFPAEIEQALQLQAARAGMDLSAYVRELVTEQLTHQPSSALDDPPESADDMQERRSAVTRDEFQSRLQAIIAMHPRSGHVDDSRESIYAGRGE